LPDFVSEYVELAHFRLRPMSAHFTSCPVRASCAPLARSMRSRIAAFDHRLAGGFT